MLFGFSTLGCPSTSLHEAADMAQRYGLDFLELRSLQNTCNLPGLFEGKPIPEIPANIRLLASSLHLTEGGDEAIGSFLEFAELAGRLGVPYVRVFGDTSFGEPLRDDALHQAAATIGICRAELSNRRLSCRMLLETHGNFSSGSVCLALNRLLPEPIEILWDAHHTCYSAGEFIQETWQSLGPLIRHIHYKDSSHNSPETGTRSYTAPGKGDYPTGQLFQHLRAENYREGVSLEWEKLWHPELPPLEVALEAFARIVSPHGANDSQGSSMV